MFNFSLLSETRLLLIAHLRQHGVLISLSTDLNLDTSLMLSLGLVMSMICTLFVYTPP